MIKILLYLCVAPGCSLPPMPLDPTLRARAVELPIKRKGWLVTSAARIGSYRTHFTSYREQDESETARIGPVRFTHTTPWERAFEVRGRGVWASKCHLDAKGLPVCAIGAQDRPGERWSLQLEAAPRPQGWITGPDDFPLQGTLRGPSEQLFVIKPVWARKGSTSYWLGFTLTSEDRVVGTVQAYPYDEMRLWVIRDAAGLEPVLVTTMYNLCLFYRHRPPSK